MYPEYASGLEQIKDVINNFDAYFRERLAVRYLYAAKRADPTEEEVEKFAGILAERADIIDKEVVNNILREFQDQRQTKRLYRYYSVNGPVDPEKIPEKAVEITNFKWKRFFDRINDEAWGYVDYTDPLTEEQCQAYELIPEGMKSYWCVKVEESIVCETGKPLKTGGKEISASILGKGFFLKCPDPEFEQCDNKKLISRNWFPSYIEAEYYLRQIIGLCEEDIDDYTARYYDRCRFLRDREDGSV